MKFSILVLLVFGSIIGSAQNCERIPRDEFRSIYGRLSTEPTDEALLDRCIPVLKRACLSTNQVVKIALLFEDDNSRLLFTRRAYKRVLNPEDYYEVFDTFNRFSSAFHLYDFINRFIEPDVIVVEPPIEIIEEPCRSTKREYESVISTLKKEVFPMRRLGLAKSLVKNQCLNVSQIKGVIGLLSIGSDRVELAKTAYVNCPNQMDYHQLIDSMTFQSDKDALLGFIQSRQ